MNLPNMINNMRIELQDRDTTSREWEDDELERAITKTVSLLSRLMPQLAVDKFTLDTVMFVNDDNILDISTVLPDFITIDRIEYPIDETPPTYPTFDVLGTKIIFRSQQTFTDGDEIRIQYHKKWTPPTISANGDYPTHLDDTIIIGAVGQSLVFKAEKYVRDSAESYETLTAPAAYTFVKPTSPTLPGAPSKPSAPTISMTDVETLIDNLETDLTEAKTFLTTGETLINKSTRGNDVGKTYAAYSDSKNQAASVRKEAAYVQLQAILAAVQKYQGEVAAYGSEVNSYASQVSGLVGLFKSEGDIESIGAGVYASQVQAFVALVNGQGAKAAGLLEVAGRYLASGQAKINEFLAALGIKPESRPARAAAAQRSE